MNWNKMTRYQKTDILIGSNNIERLGFNSTKTELEMIDLAIKNKCPIITKAGYSGKWYLKGKDKSLDELKTKINIDLGKHRDGVYIILIE
jgi:hypothetical protein